jgi:hypothetical protein
MNFKRQNMFSTARTKKRLSIKQNRERDRFLEFLIHIDIKSLVPRISFSESFRRTSEIDDSNTRSRRENSFVINETSIDVFFVRSR